MKFQNILLVLIALTITACSSFKAERVDMKESDEKAMKITDEWVNGDTESTVKEILSQMRKHRGYARYLGRHHGTPRVFIAEIQNNTSNAYFPIADMSDEFLNEISATREFVLVDAAARERILKEVTYQNDGMVDPSTAKKIGKQLGADLLIFGAVHMKPHRRKGKTIKEYSVNVRMTDIEKGVEVLRTRSKIAKYSKQSGSGW